MLDHDRVMAEVRCPLCGALWDRRELALDRALHEIKCRCKRLITYRVQEDGTLILRGVTRRD